MDRSDLLHGQDTTTTSVGQYCDQGAWIDLICSMDKTPPPPQLAEDVRFVAFQDEVFWTKLVNRVDVVFFCFVDNVHFGWAFNIAVSCGPWQAVFSRFLLELAKYPFLINQEKLTTDAFRAVGSHQRDLELDTRRKGKVHKLTPFHMKNRATNARKLYEEHLAGSRSEYTATLDEAWMYVTYCNGIRKICYIKRGNQVPVVGVMTGRGVLPLIKVPSKVKVNSEFYIECVLKPVIEQLKDLYPGEMDKVFLHHDKASSHTSNKTQQFLQEMKDTLGLNFIRNSDIPVKSPDVSPLDFYGFGMLKQRLFNRRPKTEAGLWKAAQEEWSNVSLSKVKEVFAAWKVRCREIAKKKGKHIEHMKKIHVRKIKF
ncbi:IKK1 [Cordylochernes scorpioides]|uniref:IKK1 n=1 Tax=Cordylochernes scorpioides TaxID=51811 RepID=A0ABY6KQ77_9ARAC|nr:IKK1 [Cordylochernes scorpioides]